MSNVLSPAHQAFHAHLDACPQCACQPFGLCDDGARLLRDAVQSVPAVAFGAVASGQVNQVIGNGGNQ